MTKKTVLIILSVILAVVGLVYLGVKTKADYKQGLIDQFKADSLSASMQFDLEMENGKDNYDFVRQYIIGSTGYATVVDKNMIVLMHPNNDVIGIQIPFVSLQEKIKESLGQQDGKDEFALYEYEGVEHMAYIHSWNNEVVLLILDSIDQ